MCISSSSLSHVCSISLEIVIHQEPRADEPRTSRRGIRSISYPHLEPGFSDDVLESTHLIFMLSEGFCPSYQPDPSIVLWPCGLRKWTSHITRPGDPSTRHTTKSGHDEGNADHLFLIIRHRGLLATFSPCGDRKRQARRRGCRGRVAITISSR